MSGFDEIRERAQTWTAGEHYKNTWFIDSKSAPQRARWMSPCIPLILNFFLTDIQPETICHKKMLNLRWDTNFPRMCLQTGDVWSKDWGRLFKIRVGPFRLITRSYRIFSILGKMPAIFIPPLNSAQRDTLYNLDNIWFHQILNLLRIQCMWSCIDEWIHCKVRLMKLLITICWSWVRIDVVLNK